MNTVHHTEQVIKQARVFFDDWLDLFPGWADFVQAVKSDSLAEFGGTGENTIQQVSDWLGGAAPTNPAMDLHNWLEPKTIFEIVAAAIKEAEKMLRETDNVYDFMAYFKRSRGLETLLQGNKSHRPSSDDGSSWREEEYTKAKLAIEPSGTGLGKDFLRHFLPPHTVSSNSTLQAAITAYYQEQSIH